MHANNNELDETTMNRRFSLRNSCRIADRLEKSPNITERYSISTHLDIHYAPQDATILPLIQESLLDAYGIVKTWFNYSNDLAISLWMAPEVKDLQYMVCIPCADSYFFAPGARDGINIIVFVSPLTCRLNHNEIRMTALLAHEITHHIIRAIAQASTDATIRKQNLDMPMWLEEGLCQLMECEVHPSIEDKFIKSINEISQWYDLEDLWNDLSSCSDTNSAYLQAYFATQRLVNKIGQAEVLTLLSLNRDHKTDWRELTKSNALTALKTDEGR